MSDVPVRPVSDDELVDMTFFTRCVTCGRESEWVEKLSVRAVHELTETGRVDRGRISLGRTLGCSRCQEPLVGSPGPAPPVIGTVLRPSPCPFCGEANTLLDLKRGAHGAVVCNVCGAAGPTGMRAEGPLESWNRRAPSPNEAALREIVSRLLTDGPTPEITAAIKAVEERIVKFRKETGR